MTGLEAPFVFYGDLFKMPSRLLSSFHAHSEQYRPPYIPQASVSLLFHPCRLIASSILGSILMPRQLIYPSRILALHLIHLIGMAQHLMPLILI